MLSRSFIAVAARPVSTHREKAYEQSNVPKCVSATNSDSFPLPFPATSSAQELFKPRPDLSVLQSRHVFYRRRGGRESVNGLQLQPMTTSKYGTSTDRKAGYSQLVGLFGSLELFPDVLVVG